MAVCPYCREPIGAHDVQRCPACATPHHSACWQDNGGCTVFGCACAPADEAKVSISSAAARAAHGGVRYLVSRRGQQFGPYAVEELRQYVREGRIAETDHAWCEGMPQWVSVSQVIGSRAGFSSAAPPPPLHPGPYAYGAAHTQVVVKPDNYLLAAILVTLLCCLPFGIVSIVYAAQVDSKFDAGDYAGAQQASNNARNWYHAALVGGLLALVFWILLAMIGP